MSLLNGGSTVIGPAVSLEVKPGDKIQLEVNAQFVQQSDDGLVMGLISFLAGTFGVTDGAGSETAHIYNGLENALASLAGLISNNSNQPRAYMICMVFDENYALIDPTAGNYDFYVPVPPEAATAYENLTLAIDIPTGGKYIYTYVANESAGTHVFFDDFTVKQLGVDITRPQTTILAEALRAIGKKKTTATDTREITVRKTQKQAGIASSLEIGIL